MTQLWVKRVLGFVIKGVEMREIDRRSFLASLGLGLVGAAALPDTVAHADTETETSQLKIHFIVPDAKWRSQDAIVIEIIDENGEKTFGLIDGGYGTTWANQDSNYVNRYKENNTYNPENLRECYLKVTNYLATLDINSDNVGFYLGTHPHSDHIAFAKELIVYYHPKVVFTPEYSDDYMEPGFQLFRNIDGEMFSGNNLHDNQYFYDRLIEGARYIEVPLVTTLEVGAGDPTLDSDTAEPTHTVGDIEFELLNYDPYYRSLEGFERITNANDISWGLKISAYGKTVFLAADINNNRGTEDRLAEELGHVDVLKLGHHGLTGSNTQNYLTTLSPNLVIQTGGNANGTAERNGILDMVVGARWFTTHDAENKEIDAIVVTIDKNGTITTNMDGLWTARNMTAGNLLYHDGRPAESGWHHVGDKWYWTDGANFKIGWVEIDGEQYHFESDGTLTTGWVERDGMWRFMNENGRWSPEVMMSPGGPGGFFGENAGFGGPGGPGFPTGQEGPLGPEGPSEDTDSDDTSETTEATTTQTQKKQRIGGWNNLDPSVEEPVIIEQWLTEGFGHSR